MEPGGERQQGGVRVQDVSDPRWWGLGAEEAHSAPAQEAVRNSLSISPPTAGDFKEYR